MNIQAEKTAIIEQFKEINDVNLIKAIRNLLDFALNKEQYKTEIPEEHQKLVMDRLARVKENPERLLNWDTAKKTLEG